MNDHQGEQQDAPSSSSEPLNNLKEGPESEAVPTPEEQGASSIAAGNPEEEPPAGVVDDTSTLDGGGSLARSESETESQSPPLEAKPIAPESAPVSNATATTAKDHPRAGLSEEESNERDKVSVTAHHPEPTLKVKIHLVAVGSAPILKRTKFQIGALGKTLHTSSRMGVALFVDTFVLTPPSVGSFVSLFFFLFLVDRRSQPRTSASGRCRPLWPR